MTASSQRFDKIATNYVTSEVHKDSPSIRRIHELLGAAKISSVCDVACGAGHFGLSFAQKADRLVAVDPARNMLECVRNLALAGDVNLEAIESTAEKIPLDSEQFDVVMTRLAAHHFQSIPDAVSEMMRLAKPNGYLAIIDLEGFEDKEVDEINHRLEVLHDPTHVRCYTASQWKKYIETAGFKILNFETDCTERPQGVPVSRWCEIAGSGEQAEQAINSILRSLSEDMLAALRIRRSPQGEFLMPIRTLIILAQK
jgi:ubiquinone/menaquinone biosynthesis C-methylase UbiE